MTDTPLIDVLVIGAMPVGLTLAIDLARRSIIDRAPTYPVKPIHAEIAIQESGSKAGAWIACRTHRTATAFGPRRKPQFLHQAGDPFASTMNALSGQQRVNAWAAIDLAMFLEEVLDKGGEPGIFSLVYAGRTMHTRHFPKRPMFGTTREEDTRDSDLQ